MTYITSNKNQNWLIPLSIKDMIPEDHICFLVEEFAEDLEIEDNQRMLNLFFFANIVY